MEKLLFALVWKPNGEKCPVTNLNDGQGILFYSDKGAELRRYSYLDGITIPDSPSKENFPLVSPI